MSWTNSLSVQVCVSTKIRTWRLRSLRRLTVNPPVTVLVGLANHLVDLVVGQLLADGGHDVAQLSSGDEAVVIAVENLSSLSASLSITSSCRSKSNLEGLTDFLLGVGILHLPGHHGKELYHRILYQYKAKAAVAAAAATARLLTRTRQEYHDTYQGSRWCHCCQRRLR